MDGWMDATVAQAASGTHPSDFHDEVKSSEGRDDEIQAYVAPAASTRLRMNAR